MPDTIRSSGAALVRGSADSRVSHWASFLPLPARADEQPKLVLHELVGGATRSIDRHEVAALVLLVGFVLFAVVTAILLVRTRARLARLEASSHDEIAALRTDLDRANALLLSEPQVMVDWPAASDEPTHRGRSGARRRFGAASRARLRQLARCRARPPRWSRRSRRCAAAAKLSRWHSPRSAAVRSRRKAAPSPAAPCCGSKTRAASSASFSISPAGTRSLLSEVASLRALVEKLPSPVWTRDAAGRLTFVNAAYARAVEAQDAADAVERNLELLDSSAREAIARARAQTGGLCRAGSRPSSPAPGAASMCSISAPRPAAPAWASTRPKRKPCAARSPAWSMRIAARSISFRPASPCSTPIRG